MPNVATSKAKKVVGSQREKERALKLFYYYYIHFELEHITLETQDDKGFCTLLS